jgi:arginine decarboxylase
MRCLTTADLIPADYRPAGIDQPLRSGLPNMIKVWNTDEFVLDPSRITIYIGATGIDGDTFKRSHLMDGYGVQINKTSRNTVLFMTTIGASRSSVAYLIEVLVTIARDLDTQISDSSPVERAAHERAVLRLTAPSAPLPDFSGFHPAFADEDGSCPSCAAWTLRRCTASAPTSVTWSTPARRWKSPPRPAAAGSGK